MKIVAAGENALMIYFADQLSPQVSERVHQAVTLLEQSLGNLLIDLVPSYASLLVIYDLYRIDMDTLSRQITNLLEYPSQGGVASGKLVELPVYYSLESGPDLEALAQRAGLSIDEVVALHQSQEYRVYAIGFAPGFAYLGEVDEQIAAPRLATPRAQVPRGSVGIAGRQTAVYPAQSPGGWNLIGCCPSRMFSLYADPPMPVEVGDRVRFWSIGRDDFLAMGGKL
ncbi:5-oxoprolinase subunit PxpB [Porticoccus sp.]